MRCERAQCVSAEQYFERCYLGSGEVDMVAGLWEVTAGARELQLNAALLLVLVARRGIPSFMGHESTATN